MAKSTQPFAQSNSRTSHSKLIVLREGTLQINKQKPAEALLEVFLLSKIVFYLLGECSKDEKQKLLMTEVQFAKTRLGFSFVDETGDEVSDDWVAEGVLNWSEKEVKSDLSPATFHKLQRVVAEMKKSIHDEGLLDPHVNNNDRAMRPHRFHRAMETRASQAAADCEPIPLDVASQIQPSDIVGLLSSAPPLRPKRVRLTRASSKRQQQQSPRAEQRQDIPTPQQFSGKRTLEDLRKEFDERHPESNKKRKIRKHDVVSGKEERSKIQNEHYLEMIRNHAPAFRAMNTGDADGDLAEKRKMAYSIALEVVDNDGCFVDKHGKTMTSKMAFKRVMTSLKDWKAPRRSRAPPSATTAANTGRIVSNEPPEEAQEETEGAGIDPESLYHTAALGDSIDEAIVDMFDPSDTTNWTEWENSAEV